MNKVTKKEKGFTIIEVVLVLAIAGLIFLVVFLALPALQRSQRDTQRKNDVGRLISAIQSYKSNNNGSSPLSFTNGYATSFGTVVSGYMDNNFNDPSTDSAYTLTSSVYPTTVGQMAIFKTSAADPCAASGVTAAAAGTKSAARIVLENGTYCQVL